MKLIGIILILITNNSFANMNRPNPMQEDGTGGSIVLRTFFDINQKIKTVTSYSYEDQNDRDYHQLGFKIKEVLENDFAYGLKLNFISGERNENDWSFTGGMWSWKSENEIEVDSSIFIAKRFFFYDKFRLDIEGEGIRNWSESFFTISPEFKLTYFYVRNSSFKFNVFLKYKPYFPLNFSRKDIYKESFYLGLLYNYSNTLKPSVFAKYTQTTWTESEDFSSIMNGQRYSLESDHLSLGIGLNIYL